jgi:hypothetical protein
MKKRARVALAGLGIRDDPSDLSMEFELDVALAQRV